MCVRDEFLLCVFVLSRVRSHAALYRETRLERAAHPFCCAARRAIVSLAAAMINDLICRCGALVRRIHKKGVGGRHFLPLES